MRDYDSTVFRLILLYNGDDHSRHSTGGAINCVHIILVYIDNIQIFFVKIKLVVSNVQAFRLKVRAIRSRGYFSPVITS